MVADTLKARPLKNFVAIEQISTEVYEGTSIIAAPSRRTDRVLRGRVLAKGALVGAEVEVGDEVLYECMSAHRGQTAPIDAACFGGSPGGDAYLVPVMPASLLSVQAIESELRQRLSELAAIETKARRQPLSDLDRAKAATHQQRISLLRRRKQNTARDHDWNPIQGQGKGAGVVAVVLDSEGIKDGI